jgi:hypothetical protein
MNNFKSQIWAMIYLDHQNLRPCEKRYGSLLGAQASRLQVLKQEEIKLLLEP